MCQGYEHIYGIGGEGSRTVEEGNQLLPSAFGAKGEGDGGETSDGVETENDIVVLCGRSVGEASFGSLIMWGRNGRRIPLAHR